MSARKPEETPRWLGAVADVSCFICSAPLRRNAAKRKRNSVHLCGRACIIAHKRLIMKGIVPSRRPRTRQKVEVACAHCGSPVMRWPCQVRITPRSYCNFRCRSAWRSANMAGENAWAWRGGCQDYYGPSWKRAQCTVRRLALGKCQHCGKTEAQNGRALDVHHVVPFRTFGYQIGINRADRDANRLENLIALCRKCHRAAEDTSSGSFWQKQRMNAVEAYRQQARTRTEKCCRDCGELKPLTEYHKHKSNLDGRNSYCKPCNCRRVKEARRSA